MKINELAEKIGIDRFGFDKRTLKSFDRIFVCPPPGFGKRKSEDANDLLSILAAVLIDTLF